MMNIIDIDAAIVGEQALETLGICDLETLLARKLTLQNVSFTSEQEDRLLAQFNRYGVTNIRRSQPKGSIGRLPFIDCDHVYVTDVARDYLELCKSDVFQFLEEALVISIHHLTNGGKGWTTGRANKKAKKKIKKELGHLPVSIFTMPILDNVTGDPITLTLVAVPALESPPEL
jgi:hypothetical protein